MDFNIDLNNINKKIEEKNKMDALQKERMVRTGMSMQQVASMALDRNLMPPQAQPMNPIQPPKNA